MGYIYLKNSFHGTETRIRVPANAGKIFAISDKVRRKVDRDLCGVKGCQCGKIRGANRITDGWILAIGEQWVFENVQGVL